MTVIDPMTGACLSSMRVSADMSGKNALGIVSTSPFPSFFSKIGKASHSVVAYGSNKAKKGDTYAMLLSIRPASLSPVLHWKCRLPEADMVGGLSVSPCGYYIVGGGASGSCFVWSTIGGHLLRTFKAHYRAVTCIAWSDCGKYLVTGGEDGMVHLFLLMELVERSSRNSKRTISPLNTWSSHHFPVTCLTPMDGGRMASSAEDGHIVVMELFSKQVVTTIKVPDGVTCLTYRDNRLFAGTISGAIYSMDLDAYAMLETEKQGAMMSQAELKRRADFLTTQEKLFGKSTEEEGSSVRLYRSDWMGHERPISSIAYLVEGQTERLVSGDERGEIRIWDVESRISLKVLQPWSNSTVGATTTANNQDDSKASSAGRNHPISSIMIIPQPPDSAGGSGGIFGQAATSNQKVHCGVATLIPSLQRYSQEDQPQADAKAMVPVPFVRPDQSTAAYAFWEARTMTRKRKTDNAVSNHVGNDDVVTAELRNSQQRIKELEEVLAAKTEEVSRWEKVNNKLLNKLKVKS